MCKKIYIDTETTGTDPKKHALIQLSGFILANGSKETFNFFIKPFPQDEIDEQALAISGITIEQLETFPAPEDVFIEFIFLLSKYIDRYDKIDKFLLFGYQPKFDADFLKEFFLKNNDDYFGAWFFTPPIDTMSIAAYALQKERKYLPNFKLETVADYLKIGHGKLHDAREDIALTEMVEQATILKIQEKNKKGIALNAK